MKKSLVLLVLLVALLIFTVSYFISKNFFKNIENGKFKIYCNDEGCLYTIYSIEELKDIPIISNFDKQEFKKYNISLIMIDPDLSGNFSVALINLMLYLKPKINTYVICKYYRPGCIYYTNSSDERYMWIFYKNESFLIDTNNLLFIFLEDSKNSGIEIYRNQIYLYGNSSTIIKVIDKFLLYWYGFINN